MAPNWRYCWRMRNWLAATALCVLGGSAYADVDPQITDALKKVQAKDYPSANEVKVIYDQAVTYQPDGQFTNTTHVATLVLTPVGKTQAASDSLYYAKDAEKLTVVQAQVVKADGTIVPVTAKDMQDVEQSGEANIYDPNGRAIKVTFSNLAVGDVVDLTYKLTRLLPTRTNYFNDVFDFQSTKPVLEASYTVDGPATMPLTAQIYHGDRGSKIDSTKAKVGDRMHYAWTAKNEPQLVPEAAMDFSLEVPMLVVTTDPSWQHFSQWWAQLTEAQLEATPDIKAKVKELTKDAKSDDDKIKALYDFVAQDIRYRGLGVGPRTGYTPRKASETFTSRWGVCRDVSILLTSMLRESGIQAYPVLTNVGDPVLNKIAYDGFNHAIVAMPKKGGGWTYIDPTAKNNTALLPGYEAEQSTLVSTLKGEALGAIPAIDPGANLGHATATTVIAADGSMTSKIKLETKGMFDLIVRSAGAMMSKDQQQEALEQVLHHALPEAQLVSFDISSALALFTPMEINLEIKVPNAAPKTGDYRLLRSVVTSGALGLVENVMPQLLGSEPNRKYGLDAHVTFQYDQDETITLPAGTNVVALPNDAKAASKSSNLIASCTKADATTVKCHRSFQLKSRFLDPGQYKELRSALGSMSQVARQPVILAGGKS
jgi:transglutaminase-like putative cysteine protease